MLEVLVALLALVVIWMVLLTVAVGAGFWALSRHNRVSTAHATPAPLSWVLSPSSAARQHRRLRTAVGWIERSPGTSTGPAEATEDLQRQLVAEAVAVDAHLARAARAPRSARRGLLRQTDAQVAEVERLAVRLHRLQRPPTVPPSGRPAPAPDVAANLAALRQHLDLLDAAHAELADLERHAGLGDAPDLPDPHTPPRYQHRPGGGAATPAGGLRQPVVVDGQAVEAEIVTDRPATRPARPQPRPGT